MQSIDQQIQEVELSLAEAKAQVQLGKDIQALVKSRLFKRVIEQEYFKNEAVRLVSLKSAPEFQGEAHQKMLDNGMIGIGELQRYLQSQINLAAQMEAQIAEGQEVLDELREESAE